MSDAAEIIWVTFGGKSFRCSRRTAAHLLWTAERLERRDPAAYIVVIQPCFNTGVAASAGTHDWDAVLDFQIVGMEWKEAQIFFRQCGWAAWTREPPTFSWHIHAVSLGYPGRVGVYVPGQVEDYYAHRSGLVGHAADPSWHPADIDSTIFDYDAWVVAQMALDADDKKWLDAKFDALRARMNEIAAAERARDKEQRAGVLANFDLVIGELDLSNEVQAKLANRLRLLRNDVAVLVPPEGVEP